MLSVNRELLLKILTRERDAEEKHCKHLARVAGKDVYRTDYLNELTILILRCSNKANFNITITDKSETPNMQNVGAWTPSMQVHDEVAYDLTNVEFQLTVKHFKGKPNA